MNLPTILTPAAARQEDHAPWPAPQPFTPDRIQRFDLAHIFPPGLVRLREFCSAVAETLQIPSDAVPPLAMALVSIGTSRALEIKLAEQWIETAPLWVAVLMEPGERKSALLSLLAGPVHQWGAEQLAYLRHALAAHAERRRTMEARLAGLRQRIARATGTDVAKLERDALDLAAALENLPALASPALVTSNATPEAIRELLGRNGEKIALVSAETDAGQLMGSRYAKTGSANIDLFLAAFTGDPCPSHRIGKDMALNRPALVMALCVQPQAVGEVLRDTVARGRGLVDRLCLIQPASRMGTRVLHPDAVPSELMAWWSDSLLRLLSLPWPGRVLIDSTGPIRHEAPPRRLSLTPEAEAVFDALRTDLESRIGEGGDLRSVCGFVSKLPGVVARIALALEAMQNPHAECVSGDTMRAAVAWAPGLLGHFRFALGDACEGDDVKLARRLLAAVKRRGLAELSARDALRCLDGNSLTTAELQPALELLTDRGWLRIVPPVPSDVRTGRPPSLRYAVNPAAFGN